MSVQDFISQKIYGKKAKKFEDQASWALVLLGILTFFIAGFLGLMFADVVPKYMKAINEGGFTKLGVALGVFLGLYAIPFWFCGCIASRCHSILYKRWFK